MTAIMSETTGYSQQRQQVTANSSVRTLLSGVVSISTTVLQEGTFQTVVDYENGHDVSCGYQTAESRPEIDCWHLDFPRQVVGRNERHRRHCHCPPPYSYCS